MEDLFNPILYGSIQTHSRTPPRRRASRITKVISSKYRALRLAMRFIPKKIALEVTPERLRKIESDKKRAQDQARLRLEQAFEIQKQLDGQVIPFTLKGKGTKVFGGLAEREIGTRINEKYGIHFSRNKISNSQTRLISKQQVHTLSIHITRDTLAKVIVEVTIGIES